MHIVKGFSWTCFLRIMIVASLIARTVATSRPPDARTLPWIPVTHPKTSPPADRVTRHTTHDRVTRHTTYHRVVGSTARRATIQGAPAGGVAGGVPRSTPPGGAGSNGVSAGQCQFPVEWRSGKQWWRGYVNNNVEISVSGLDYIYETFGTKSISTFQKSQPNEQLSTYNCLGAGRRGEAYIYVLVHDNKLFCREYAEDAGILLLRWISVGILPGTIPSIQDCADALSSMSSYEVLPLFNPQTGEVGVQDCPLPSGVYRTTVVEQTSLGRKTFCEGRADSRTIINKAKIDVETCLRADSYEKPYYSYMYCVANWDGNKLGNNFGSVAASDKSVLLLYQNKNTNARPHFYVGRYRTDAAGKLLLSLYVADVKGITGVLTATAEQKSSAYKNFIFTKTGEALDQSGRESLTDNPINARCLGGCLNGVCRESAAGWTCDCKLGYDGKSCETALTRGSCDKKPCVNGVCQQHGNHYYCSCNEGYTGLNCDVSQYCLPNPCARGPCYLFQGGYKCRCPDGYTGRSCADNVVAEAEEDKRILIVLTTLLSVFVVGVVVVAIIICQCRRKKEEKLMPANPDGDLPNQTYSSMTSWFPDYKRELAAAEEAYST